MLVLEAAALLIGPVVAGLCVGVLLRRWLGRRFAGVAGLVGCLALPAAVVAAVTIAFPVIGLWDAITEGFLCGVGVLWAAHSVYADSRNMLVTAGAVAASFLILEGATRLLIGNAPAYPVGNGPHLLLSTLLRTTGPDSSMFQHGAMPYFLEMNAMEGDLKAASIAERPPSAMVTKEIVCSIVYGAAYSGVIDVSRERGLVFPEGVVSRPGATRRVLHIGDSMVFGANVRRDQTFTADLEKLEPEVQHINAGISGMAPDDYLAVLQSWVEREPLDLAAMYLFAGNDMVGLDAPHPCSDWQSILVYEDDHAHLRFPLQPKSDRRIGLRWLIVNSPLPFLGRVMIVAGSRMAAFLGALLDSWAAEVTRPNIAEQIDHLEAILRTARDELHGKGIPFVIVVLPHADAIDQPGGSSEFLSTHVSAVARKLGLPLLDATEVIRDALSRGESPIQTDRSHFNAEGHWLIAKWLHKRLTAAASRQNQPPQGE